jgi:hypothetical protein
MRRLVLGTLIVIMPFSGMRVICVDSPEEATTSSAPSREVSECERLCPLHQPSDTPSSTKTDQGCALSADGCSLIAFASIAAFQPQEPPQVPLVVLAVYAESPRFCLEPELAPVGPPPKPQAL